MRYYADIPSYGGHKLNYAYAVGGASTLVENRIPYDDLYTSQDGNLVPDLKRLIVFAVLPLLILSVSIFTRFSFFHSCDIEGKWL